MLIPVDKLVARYGVKIKGVLHLGAHQAEEAPAYEKAGAEKVIWIEGNPELMPVLENELKKFNGHKVYNVLVSDTEGKDVEFKVTNNFQSSSILDMGSHKSHHPEVKVHHTLKLKTHRLDRFFKDNGVDTSALNFLNIDLQGAELMAMKGLGDLLEKFEFVYTEVNTGSVYKNCPTLIELDRFMENKGFFREALSMTRFEWGDALYVKRKSTAGERMKNRWIARKYQVSGFLRRIFRNAWKKTRNLLSKIKQKFFPSKTGLSDISANGELFFLQKVVQRIDGKIIVFDAGANVGDYTRSVVTTLQEKGKDDYEIHLFEPQQKCYNELVEKFGNDQRIVVNHLGLSDVNGEAEIHFDFSGSSSASLYERKEISLHLSEKIKLKRLEDYIREKNISHISLLKIDTEGNEKKVLSGGGEFIRPGFTHAIQFEYGGTYLDAGVTLAEVVQMLLNKKYETGKLMADSVRYQSDLGHFPEDYAYANYVATDKKLV